MSSTTFDPAVFKLRYPEFSAVDETLLGLYFNEATLYLRNDGSSVVKDIPVRMMLLNMLTAHICELNNALSARGSQPLVGRISSVGEGAVNVKADMDSPSAQNDWLNQTKYGAALLAAMRSCGLLSIRMFPGPSIITTYPLR